MSFDYHSIQDLAKIYKCRSDDLVTLSKQNDPYYMLNNPYAERDARWFAGIYEKYWRLLTDPLVRQLHYVIIHQEVILPDGKTRYSNLQKHYEKLTEAAKAARYLRYVPADIVDEAMNQPKVFLPDTKPNPKLAIDTEYWSEIELYSFPDLPHYDLSLFPVNQKYELEIWCEKTYSSLERLAQKYNAVYQSGTGELSVACAHMLTQRREKYHRPIRVFYVHDYDPAGEGMPVSIARKLEFFLEDIRGSETEPDVRLYNLVLTPEQIEFYNLPPAPVKETDSRANMWIAQRGQDVVELNALEGHPERKGELIGIVERALLRYYDTGLSRRVFQAESELREQLEEIEAEVYGGFPVVERLREEYDEIESEFAPRVEALNEGIKDYWQMISDSLNELMPDLEEYFKEHPLPECKPADEIENPLYDSKRSYFEQHAKCREHQRKRIVY